MFETALFNINDLTVLSAGILSLALCGLLAARRNQQGVRNLLLAAFFVQTAVYSIDTLLYWNRTLNALVAGWSTRVFFVLGIGFFLQGPLLYWSVRASIRRHFRMRLPDLIHLLPAAVFPFWLYVVYYRVDDARRLQFVQDWSSVNGELAFHALILAERSSAFLYGLASVWQLHRYLSHLRVNTAAAGRLDIRWLKALVYGFAFVNAWHMLILAASHLDAIGGAGYAMGTMENYFRLVLLAWLAAYVMRGSAGFPAIQPEYVIGSVSGSDALDLQLRKLKELMESEKPYLQPNINVDRLASRLNMSPRMLSTLINKKLGQNFFDMIRDYRLEEARRRLVDEDCRSQTINEIMQGAGFNSKSVFNQSFKEKYGVTPSYFRRQHLS